jgi:hypothetical protein
VAHERTDWLTSNLATVAMATGMVAFKQLAFEGQIIEFLSVPLGAGLVMGYLEWRRRQGDPGLTPERLAQTGPAPGGLAKVPAVAAIVIGTFCLLHGVTAFLLLCLYFAVSKTRVKAAAGEDAARPLSQVLGELLIVDVGAPKPEPSGSSVPASQPLVREAAPKPPAEPPRAIVETPAPDIEVTAAPLGTTGLPLTTPSTLGTGIPLSLESRLPSVLESSSLTLSDSLGGGGSVSGFDEALALLQGKPTPTDRGD